MKRFLLTAILTLLVVSGAVHAQPEPSARLSPNVLQRRGHDLRRDLIGEYRRERVGGLIVYRKASPDISALVAKYIPAGTSFADAVAILDAAGRRHRRHPPETGRLEPDAEGNIFESVPMPGSILGFGVSYGCAITLVPSAPGEFTTVAQVKAGMFVSYL
jgi:hypothetical protein